MKFNKYKVVLEGFSDEVYAANEEQAIILIQAIAIQNARNYELVSIEKIK